MTLRFQMTSQQHTPLLFSLLSFNFLSIPGQERSRLELFQIMSAI